ncbi:hypothetical protein JCGZ_15552 [Jatropha curcas]|uniref:G-patch domain-containing protein n=1 Tax=Jatropha curcas TaxID=180498 RepID=A0A067K3H6_JATCU|nr:hypothetical protein JCGZ_15552 [Jatropha curcas]
MMKKMNWQHSKGLGWELQGRFEPLSSALGQQDKRGLGYSENRTKEKYEVRSPIKASNVNQILFVPQAKGEFQSRGKTYPGLEIFMTDYEEKLVKSPEPSLEQLVDGTEFMVCMTEASTESEWLKKIPKFEDFLGIGDEASKLVQEQKAKARILQSVLAAEDAEEAERKASKPAEEKIEAAPGEEEEGN